MGRNEIRLKRQNISSGRIAKHRNYEQLMERHERQKRIKRTTSFLIYFAIFTILMVLIITFLMMRQWEHKGTKDKKAVIEHSVPHNKI